MYDIVIKNGLSLINDDFIISNIGIKGNKIEHIGREEIEGEIQIDAKDKIVLPGLFNAHTHAAMTLMRGYAEGVSLKDWLERIWNVEKKLTPDDVYWGTMLGILEMLKTGTTSFSDHYFHMDSVGKAVADSGMRAILCFGMMDSGNEEKADKKLKKGTEFVKKWNNKHNRIKAGFGPHSLYTCSLRLLRGLRKKTDELDATIHIHAAESREEVEYVQKKYRKKPIELLDEIGMLGPNLVIAHAIWLDSHEISILGKRGVSVVHNPVSNLKLAQGIAKIYEMVSNGVNVCLGTDGAASNNNYNLFEELKMASLLQKHRLENPKLLSEKEVFYSATQNGYSAYRLNGGALEKGKLADIILLNKKLPQYTPIYNLLSSLIYSSYGCEITHSIIDGNLVMEDKVTKLNEEKIFRKASRISKKFIQ